MTLPATGCRIFHVPARKKEHNPGRLRCGTRMVKPGQHPLLVLALSTTLSLSSVGLPVIVVACEMGKAVVTQSCATSCFEPDPAPVRITRIPCRAECFFIERSTTASLPPKPHAEPPGLRIVLVMPVDTFSAESFTSTFISPDESPPLIHDNIPVFTSTLLI